MRDRDPCCWNLVSIGRLGDESAGIDESKNIRMLSDCQPSGNIPVFQWQDASEIGICRFGNR